MRALFLCLTLFLLGACSRRAVDATPEGAVRELVERLGRASGDPLAAKAAFDLLSKSTQENLVERALRYGAASGKHIAPEAMIAPASFVQRFSARDLRSEIVGSHARVHVIGLLPGQEADVLCVFEDGGWRVNIDLPPLAPLDVRPREAPTQVGSPRK